MYLNHGGGKSLGWFTKSELYKFYQNIHGAVYSFSFCDKKPDDKVLPYELEDTFYVGISGGKKGVSTMTYDLKDNNTGRGMLYTNFAKRMKTHFSNFEKYDNFTENKYELFHEKYHPHLNKNKQIYVNLCLPGPETKDVMIRSYMSLVESEFIYLYGLRFDTLPLMNLAEQEGKKFKEGSVSQKKLLEYMSGNVENFI